MSPTKRIERDSRVVLPRETTTTTTRRILPVSAVDPDDPRPQLRVALANGDRMGIDAWVRAVFGVEAIREIWVHRVLPDRRQAKVGVLQRHHLNEDSDVEEYLLANFNGPGSFVLSAVAKGHMYWHKHATLGVGDQPAAGVLASEAGSIDAEIAAATRRLSAMATLKELRSIVGEAGDGATPGKGDDEMKVTEALALIEAVRGAQPQPQADRTTEVLLQLLRAEREARQAERNAGPAWLAGLAPLVSGIAEKVGPKTIDRLLDRLVPGAAAGGAAVVVEPPSTWATVVTTLTQALAPMLQPLIEAAAPSVVSAVAARMNGAPLPPPTTVREPARPPQAAIAAAEAGPIREASVPSVNPEVTAYLVERLSERDFGNAWTVLDGTPEFEPWLAQLRPESDPRGLWIALKAYDVARLGTVGYEEAMDFMGWCVKQMEAPA